MLRHLFLLGLWAIPIIASKADERDYVLTNKLLVPRVGFGTAGLGDKAVASLQKALEVGFRHIDTAQATEWYDEESVGQVLESLKDSIPRKEVFITTKIHPRHFGYQQTLAAFEESLAKLRTDYVDLLLLHSPSCWEGLCEPDPARGTYADSWRALEDLYKEGKVKAIGVSNFDRPLLEDLSRKSRGLGGGVGVHAVQNWMDPLRQDREVRAWCAERSVLYTSYSTLGVQWQRHHGEANPVLSHPVITDIAQAHGGAGVSPALVVLAWALAEGVAIIPRSSNPKHIEELATLLGDADSRAAASPLSLLLTAEEVDRINALEEEYKRQNSSSRDEL